MYINIWNGAGVATNIESVNQNTNKKSTFGLEANQFHELNGDSL